VALKDFFDFECLALEIYLLMLVKRAYSILLYACTLLIFAKWLRYVSRLLMFFLS